MKHTRVFGFAALVLLAAMSVANAQSQWQPVQNVPNIGAGAIALLTDGRILVHDESGNAGTWGNWWTLTPDINGSYLTGTWKQVATMPANYGPLYFSSAVLPDGRYITEGGEYNFGAAKWTSLGAIYDPVANTWTAVNPPSGWSNIGDAPSLILTNGTYMQTNCCAIQSAYLNPSTLTWTPVGSGKYDVYDEEGIELLPNTKAVTVDCYVGKYMANGMNSEIYDSGAQTWSSAGSTGVQLWDSANGCGGAGSASYETGPAVLRNDGTVWATGANSCAAGHTATYNPSNGTWTPGPDFPGIQDVSDGPAALEPNGKVLVFTSPLIFQPGGIFYEWDGSSLSQVVGPPLSASDTSYNGHLLVLPTGQILFTDFSNDVEIYTPTGSPDPNWQPSILLPNLVFHKGTTITLFGHKFNGASQANSYGDDFQDATNYPIVRITNNSTGHVFYARTHDHNSMAVGFQGPTYTKADIPAATETGASTMEVIANGNPSKKYQIVIQ